MKNTRIVFMGTPAFAANVLRGLLSEGYSVVGVVTQQDKKVGRKQILTPSPVKEVAMEYGLPIFQPAKIRQEYDDILKLEPELIITCAYGQIIPKEMLVYPKFGCINTHGSLLPKYRGGAPIQWSIIHGEKETGITIMYMSEKMDEGDILFQRAIPIEVEDTNASMFEKLSDLAKDMLIEFLPKLLKGEVSPLPQNHDEASYAWNLRKEDEFISFARPVRVVYNHIRGLLEAPGAYGVIEGKKYKFKKVSYLEEVSGEAGSVIGLHKNALAIGAIDGTILVEVIQPEGKKAMNAKEFFNGSGKNMVGKKFDEEIL